LIVSVEMTGEINPLAMKITITNPPTHSRNLLRRAGYGLHVGRDREVSYVRRLSGGDYPHFHVYVNSENGSAIEITLHLDEKKPSYEGFTAHSGEYEGEIVEQEKDRILGTIGS
jgi:hypothetical protein